LNTLTRSSDPYTISKASHILSILLSNGINSDNPPSAVEEYLKFLTNFIVGSPLSKRNQALTALKDVLKEPYSQHVFAKIGGLKCLNLHFNAQEQNTQLLYLSGFCVWLLTFNRQIEVIEELKKFEVVKRLADIVKHVVREKVIRISFCALRNLLKYESESFVEEMIGHGLTKLIATFLAPTSGRKWKDQDLVKDMTFLQDVLQKKIEQLSSFEMYLTELTSGNLQWSPVHSDTFWSEHKTKFEEKNFDLVKKLIECLDSDNELTVEVACYDVGEFARFHPEGRRVVTRLSGKIRLMQKMNHKNAKIAKQALLAVQKIMVQNWEFLTKGKS